jgi:two-component system chemotaxis response regulator CheB
MMTTNDKPLFIITIGASAGGLNAVMELVAQLPADIPAAIFIVLHMPKAGQDNFLIQRLQKNTKWKCILVENTHKILPTHIYIAPKDRHILIKDDNVITGKGPAENRWRPSIDVLFRSAAISKGNAVIGIILTGLLNDGAAGMQAVKRCGGYCIVQDPNEAEYPDMPLSVLENIEADHIVPLAGMVYAIQEIIKHAELKKNDPPTDLIIESFIAEKVATGIEIVKPLGKKSVFTCPDCGGGLWSVEDMPHIRHYRCHIGHSYSEEDLVIRQIENIEATLWIAVRMMEERKNILQKMSRRDSGKGSLYLSGEYTKTAEGLETHITKLKELLFAILKP